MPCPHHLHHHHSHNTCCCCCCNTNTCTEQQQQHRQQQQQQQLLQTLTAILFQSPPPLPLPITTLHSSSQYLQPHLHSLFANSHHHQQQKQQHEEYQQQEQENAVHSLLERIAALESTLPLYHPFSPCSPLPQQPQRQQQPLPTVKEAPFASPAPRPRPPSPLSSLRDLAARTIQAAFRRFIVRRSQALRQLKDLAAIKSRVASLKPALSSSKGRYHDPRALSQAAMDLLVQLESIQSGYQMIREGKRSISRELVRILDFIDKFMLKEHHQGSLKAEEKDIDSTGGNRNIAKAGVGTKKVSFLDDDRRGLRNSLFNEGYCIANGEQNGYGDNLGDEFPGIRLRDRSEELQHGSDDERSSEGSIAENGGRYVSGGHFKMHSSKRGLSAPMPAQMEPRRN